eukprot:tig00000317_g24028.t1
MAMRSSGNTSRDVGAYAGGTHVLDLSDDLISAVFQHLDPKREGVSVPRVCRRFAVAWRAARFASLELAAPSSSAGLVRHALRSSAGVRAALSELQQLRVSRFPCSSLGDVRGLPFLRRLHLDAGELPVVPEEGPLAERVAASVRALLAGLRRDRIRALDLVGWPMDAEHVAALGELTRLEALKFSRPPPSASGSSGTPPACASRPSRPSSASPRSASSPTRWTTSGPAASASWRPGPLYMCSWDARGRYTAPS